MTQIKNFPFSKDKINELKNKEFGTNWPSVYLIENQKEMYVGETVDIYNRALQHLENTDRTRLNKLHVITDEEFNKSATLDIESSLIQYIAADGKYLLQNGNRGLLNHNYFDKQKYQAKFELVWEQLKKLNLVSNDLIQIRNTEIFKYSPYKALTEEQITIVESLLDFINTDKATTFIINGGAGTGKTILAIYLMKTLVEFEATKHLKVALVVPMTSLRDTLRKVFKGVKNLKPSMVIGPSDVVGGNFDILLVDEAHRLKKRKNITNFMSFDIANKKLGLGSDGTELDWILLSSKQHIMFFDKNQSVRPSDIHFTSFENLNSMTFELKSQIRVGVNGEGDKYIELINSIFDKTPYSKPDFKDYDFRVFAKLEDMVSVIKEKEKYYGLARLVSGYAWEWQSKNDGSKFDIEIGETKLKWNSTTKNWVNSPNAINEVGCIHTVQGYDLNYAGVIIGPELSFDFDKNEFVINASHYRDMNGKRGIEDPEELKRYIINIYKTLLTRGIKGTYVYIVDESLRRYFLNKIS